ncbi:MAG TPA: TonB family protein [Gallionellaceae bacterium]|nr:TonB family protein [Gallionellaceae bacterium]
MKTFAAWSPPVAASLLLHAILIVLVTHQLSNTDPNKKLLQTISVELQGQAPVPDIKPSTQKTATLVKPRADAISEEQKAADDSVPAETNITPQEQTPPQPASAAATQQQQPALNVQPLSTLTRPPAFLRKIEPVYPGSERRAGSQAQVIAEVTIDQNGTVVGVKIVKSAGMHFDNAVTEALHKSMFTPGYIDKESVAVRVLVPFRFNLK